MSDKSENKASTSKTKQRARPSDAVIIALIGLVGTIIAAVVSSPAFERWVSTTRAPTESVTAIVTSTFQAVDSTETVNPTETLVPGATQTEVYTLTPIPLPAEFTDPKGVHMVLIPAGEFEMGSDIEIDERPVHTVYIDNFYVDRYEVTNMLYRACVAVNGCEKPKNTSKYNKSENVNHPVIYVDWEMANAYCEWRGGYLPTEAQWEKAARGTDGSKYPWGNTIDSTFANYLDVVKGTREVGSYSTGQSDQGAYDLAGNVWEWVADRYGSDYYLTLPDPVNNPTGPTFGNARVIRGGSWNDDANALRSSNRAGLDFSSAGDDLGFRCAKDATP